jgi:hypothetical protein
MKKFLCPLLHNFQWLTMTAIAGFCLMEGKAIAAAPASLSPQAPSAMQEDIRDIRPPYHIPPGWVWLAWTAGSLALVAAGHAAWRWRHRLGVRVKLPYELALTGGTFYRADSSEKLQAIYDQIDRLEKTTHTLKKFESQGELFGWAVLPALGLLGVGLGLQQTRFRRLP